MITVIKFSCDLKSETPVALLEAAQLVFSKRHPEGVFDADLEFSASRMVMTKDGLMNEIEVHASYINNATRTSVKNELVGVFRYPETRANV